MRLVLEIQEANQTKVGSTIRATPTTTGDTGDNTQLWSTTEGSSFVMFYINERNAFDQFKPGNIIVMDLDIQSPTVNQSASQTPQSNGGATLTPQP